MDLSKGVVVARVIIYNRNDGDASHASMVSSRLSNSVVSLLNHQGDILKTYRIWDATEIPIFDINFMGLGDDCGELFCVVSGQENCHLTNHPSFPGYGSCVWDGEGSYIENEKCVIQTIAPSTITAVDYNVEADYDWIRILFPSENSASGYASGICPGQPNCDWCALNGHCSGTISGVNEFNAMADLSATPIGTQLQWSTDNSINKSGFIICFSNLVSRIRLQLKGRNWLHLREVEVFDQNGVNRALHKPATQSSTHGCFEAPKAVNGDLNDFSHTLEDTVKYHFDQM